MGTKLQKLAEFDLIQQNVIKKNHTLLKTRELFSQFYMKRASEKKQTKKLRITKSLQRKKIERNKKDNLFRSEVKKINRESSGIKTYFLTLHMKC